jgi:hypothetical protein
LSFFLALPQNLDKNINFFHIPYSNNLADLSNVNKEFLPKIPLKKYSQKVSPKKFLSPKNPPKKFKKIKKKILRF